MLVGASARLGRRVGGFGMGGPLAGAGRRRAAQSPLLQGRLRGAGIPRLPGNWGMGGPLAGAGRASVNQAASVHRTFRRIVDPVTGMPATTRAPTAPGRSRWDLARRGRDTSKWVKNHKVAASVGAGGLGVGIGMATNSGRPTDRGTPEMRRGMYGY